MTRKLCGTCKWYMLHDHVNWPDRGVCSNDACWREFFEFKLGNNVNIQNAAEATLRRRYFDDRGFDWVVENSICGWWEYCGKLEEITRELAK